MFSFETFSKLQQMSCDWMNYLLLYIFHKLIDGHVHWLVPVVTLWSLIRQVKLFFIHQGMLSFGILYSVFLGQEFFSWMPWWFENAGIGSLVFPKYVHVLFLCGMMIQGQLILYYDILRLITIIIQYNIYIYIIHTYICIYSTYCHIFTCIIFPW
jgi:hypothetical protein